MGPFFPQWTRPLPSYDWSGRRPLTRLRSVGLLLMVWMIVIVAPAQTNASQRPSGTVPHDWRPYDHRSPLNARLPRRLVAHPRSDAMVAALLAHGPVSSVRTGHAGTSRDYGKALYQSGTADPVYTVKCVDFGGDCPIDGHRIRIPDDARPAGGTDAHLAVIDRRSGWEYDLWAVRRAPRDGGLLEIGWGGRTRVRGDGLQAGATAAGFGLVGSVLRGGELAAGRVNHALAIAVPCTSGKVLWPASGDSLGATCDAYSLAPDDALAIGARLALRMSDQQIRRLRAPRWKKAILRAMAHYGMYVGDTHGTDNGFSFALGVESGDSYATEGLRDPMLAVARKSLGHHVETDAAHAGEYLLDVHTGVDWRKRLVVLR